MSKLTRYTQDQFGTNAGSSTMSQFGSFAAGTPQRYSGSTITPALVQNLSNYLTGWTGAIVGNNSLLLEDLNALCWLYAYQFCYLFQEGIPEWDSGTEYYSGSFCQNSGVIYQSLADSNLNNSVTASNNAYWTPLLNGGQFAPVASQASIEITSGNSLMIPWPTISVGDTYTVDAGGYFVGVQTMIVNGTFIVDGNSKII